MLTLGYARQSRCFLSPLLYSTTTTATTATTTTTTTTTTTSSATPYPGTLSLFPSFSFPSTSPRSPSSPSQFPSSSDSNETLLTKNILLPFKQWFASRRNPLLDQIFEIVGTQEDLTAYESLRCLNVCITEKLVLDVLKYGKSHKDLFSCVRFFDWAGNQTVFSHTLATFHAMFQIFNKAKCNWVIHDFVEKLAESRSNVHHFRFYDTLVIGYSVAGKPEMALQVFGKMRFQGLDLSSFAYRVFLNSLVDEGFLDVVPIMVKQIRGRELENEITHSIMMKNFCKTGDLNRAEEYLRCLVTGNGDRKPGLRDALVAILVDALCRAKLFKKADALVKEMETEGVVSKDYAYGSRIRYLIQAGKLDGALKFYKNKMEENHGYFPDIRQYNSLVCKLMKEYRLREVFELLIEMKELKILPDKITMNATICFFCKAGMVDAALELYETREEFGLSINSITYNCLMNTLFSDTRIDNAYHVLKNAIKQGYFPGKKTFTIIIDALCREKKLDEVKELILTALDRNITPGSLIYGMFIKALCRSSRIVDGYKVLGELNRFNANTIKSTYFNLINGFNQVGRGDLSSRLLVEMQEKGHNPTRKLFRAVLFHLCNGEEGERQFFKLLEFQLSHSEPSCNIYNLFIDGAGHAWKPLLAKKVYLMMNKSNILPNLQSYKLLLISYLKSGRVTEALNFFNEYSSEKRQESSRKYWNIMIVGLCKVMNTQLSWEIFWKMRRRKNMKPPSIECYEELVKLLCSCKQYSKAFEIIDDLDTVGRPIPSYIGNILLFNSLYSRELFNVWYKKNRNDSTTRRLMIGELINFLSYPINGKQDVEKLEILIQRCFNLNIYTYNMLLKKITMFDINLACEYFDKLFVKGYEPNRWSYDILIHGLLKNGRSVEAQRLAENMDSKGFFDLNRDNKNTILRRSSIFSGGA